MAKEKYVKEVIKKLLRVLFIWSKKLLFNFDLSVRPNFYVKFGSKVEMYEDNDLEKFMLSNPDYYRQCHENKFQVVLGDMLYCYTWCRYDKEFSTSVHSEVQ